ncbi:MAG: GNAT family N-acetyltransferase, partial [Anaerolineae bacterium]|nr:GNAT family N-acetyltransferase [Anaerolineae bacterium]
MNIPTLYTSRLTLRPFRREDAHALFNVLSEKDILRYFPNPETPTLEQTKMFIKHQLDHWDEHGFGWWAVAHRDNRSFLGWNGLQYLPDTDEIEVGFLLSKAYWGKGLATEGTIASLQYGFDELKIDSIVGIVHPKNIASQKVLKKAGCLSPAKTNT